ncbi:MAG: choice-of-anchor M domain-containing protein [Akkermansiaceae bacterium]|jgi:surface-anchored protein
MKKIVPLLALAGVGSSQAVLFTAGELDFGVILEGSDFELEAHDVDNDIEYEVADITVLTGADREFTATTDLPGAGVTTGDSLWILPQENVVGVPYVALASEELLDIGNGALDWSTNITFTLGTVTSPSGSGTFSVWSTDGLGINTFIFSSTNPGATANNNNFESSFGHDHVNWGFTEPGVWSVDLTASGTHVTLGELTTTETLTFNVIPEPSTGLMALLSVVGLSMVRRRK